MKLSSHPPESVTGLRTRRSVEETLTTLASTVKLSPDTLLRMTALEIRQRRETLRALGRLP